ncbi:MAG: RluA family pseudouridine synthase [Verrucomicrobiae bacterium]|nr:RluA family pseudouridine synthase [Verrucomicrobiae bacterium]
MASGFWTQWPILYEDQWLLIINKPAGVLSHPNEGCAGRKDAPVAFEGGYDAAKRCFSSQTGHLWLLHRLDQDTSGVLLAAKDQETAQACRLLFEKKQVQKDYLTLVFGRPVPPKGCWRDCLEKRQEGGKVRSRVCRHRPPNAELCYEVEKSIPRWQLSLLRVRLLTGRTHQIRVQAAAHRCPVAGDGVYGDFQRNREMKRAFGLKRLFLHAATLGLNHPGTGKKLSVEASLADDLQKCLEEAAKP